MKTKSSINKIGFSKERLAHLNVNTIIGVNGGFITTGDI